MECCLQQAHLPELIQDEDVCDSGCDPHAVWSVSQPLQPPVSHTFRANLFPAATRHAKVQTDMKSASSHTVLHTF